jgi:hypothetical protein
LDVLIFFAPTVLVCVASPLLRKTLGTKPKADLLGQGLRHGLKAVPCVCGDLRFS